MAGPSRHLPTPRKPSSPTNPRSHPRDTISSQGQHPPSSPKPAIPEPQPATPPAAHISQSTPFSSIRNPGG